MSSHSRAPHSRRSRRLRSPSRTGANRSEKPPCPRGGFSFVRLSLRGHSGTLAQAGKLLPAREIAVRQAPKAAGHAWFGFVSTRAPVDRRHVRRLPCCVGG